MSLQASLVELTSVRINRILYRQRDGTLWRNMYFGRWLVYVLRNKYVVNQVAYDGIALIIDDIVPRKHDPHIASKARDGQTHRWWSISSLIGMIPA